MPATGLSITIVNAEMRDSVLVHVDMVYDGMYGWTNCEWKTRTVAGSPENGPRMDR